MKSLESLPENLNVLGQALIEALEQMEAEGYDGAAFAIIEEAQEFVNTIALDVYLAEKDETAAAT